MDRRSMLVLGMVVVVLALSSLLAVGIASYAPAIGDWLDELDSSVGISSPAPVPPCFVHVQDDLYRKVC